MPIDRILLTNSRHPEPDFEEESVSAAIVRRGCGRSKGQASRSIIVLISLRL